jgi:oxygen-independent coproporphyrinogen-3 oxidase
VPFCPSKCHFCFWVAPIPVRDLRLREEEQPRIAYVEALQRQIRHTGPELASRGYQPRLMYWGGGTASILSVREFREVMGTLREHLDLTGVAEATMECSPDTLTEEKLAAYREAGFERISIGVQSFDDKRLIAQGRSHRSAQARRAVQMAADAGFTEINVDLMCGLPDETLEEFEASARAAVTLPVTHISLYPYNPIRGTVAARRVDRGDSQLDRDERLTAYIRGREIFEAAGFPEYAMSYFGRTPCRADLAYYRLEMDYVGFGSGAGSILDGEYFYNHRILREYLADPLGYDERVPATNKAEDYLLFHGLTLFDGVDARQWQDRLGVPLQEILVRPQLAEFVSMLERDGGLIRDEQGIRLPRERIAPTLIGMYY